MCVYFYLYINIFTISLTVYILTSISIHRRCNHYGTSIFLNTILIKLSTLIVDCCKHNKIDRSKTVRNLRVGILSKDLFVFLALVTLKVDIRLIIDILIIDISIYRDCPPFCFYMKNKRDICVQSLTLIFIIYFAKM